MKAWLDPRRLPELYDLTGKKPRKKASVAKVLSNPKWDFGFQQLPLLSDPPYGLSASFRGFKDWNDQLPLNLKRWADTLVLHHGSYFGPIPVRTELTVDNRLSKTLQGMLAILDEEVR